MGWREFLFGGPATAEDDKPAVRKPRGLTRAERRSSRQQQLSDLQERIALEEARARVRLIRARGRKKADGQAAPSPIASVRETLEEALDLADSLRGGRRDSEPTAPAPDAPGWERLLNSAAGVRFAEAVAPSLAPLVANLIAGSLPAPSAQAPGTVRPGAEPSPSAEDETLATNLIASVVAFVDRPAEQAASAVYELARAQAVNGNTELLNVLTQAVRTPVSLVRLVANRYRLDPTHGHDVSQLLDRPGYLDTLLRALKALMDTSANQIAR